MVGRPVLRGYNAAVTTKPPYGDFATSAGTRPFFGPGSLLRKVAGESAGVLGGGRALLLQLAHPLVAAGVADHSNFRADPLARLERTLESMLSIVFGQRHEAEVTLRQL